MYKCFVVVVVVGSLSGRCYLADVGDGDVHNVAHDLAVLGRVLEQLDHARAVVGQNKQVKTLCVETKPKPCASI